MKISNANVRMYLDRFFEGNTTRAEEIALSAYFRETEKMPDDLIPYKKMFGWIDSGMREPIMPLSRRVPMWRRIAMWSLSAAAAVGLAICSIYTVDSRKAAKNRELIYAGSFVVHGNVRNDNISEIWPEIQKTMQACEEMEKDFENIDFNSPIYTEIL